MTIGENKRKKEIEEVRQQAKTEKERLERNMAIMKEAGMKTQSRFQSKLEAAADRERQANEDFEFLRRELDMEKENTKAQKLEVDLQKRRLEREARETQAQLQNHLSAYADREVRNNGAMQNLRRQLENDSSELATMRNQVKSLQDQLMEAKKPGFLKQIWKAIW